MVLSRLRAIDEVLLESADALRVSEKGFAEAAARTPTPVFVHDGESILFANQRFSEWLGYDAPFRLVGHPLTLLAAEDDQRSMQAAIGVGRPPPPYPHVQRFRQVSGRAAVAHVLARQLPAFPGGTLVVAQPGSASYRSQEMLRLLEAAVDHLHDIVFITEAESIDDVGRRIVYVNRAYCELTGFEPREVLGKTPNLTIGPETDRGALGRIEQALEARRPVREQLLKYGKQGQKYWVEIDIIPIFDEDGAHTHWVSVQRDITRIKELERRVEQAEARLRSDQN